MAQIYPDRRLSLSLLSQKAGQKQKGQILAVSAQLMALVSALRSLSSVALSSARVLPVYHLLPTPLRQGDISTLQERGHFYFALTDTVAISKCLGETMTTHKSGLDSLLPFKFPALSKTQLVLFKVWKTHCEIIPKLERCFY